MSDKELTPAEIAKGFIRPLRATFRHDECGEVMAMSNTMASNCAKDPKHYAEMFCMKCKSNFSLKEFRWYGTQNRLGT